jgi:glycosyltransferase involved in cell wall biosynthesis
MTPLSVIVITKNEAHNIEECLKSVSWADDIIIVDAESTDDTVEKAKQYAGKIFIQPWMGFAAAKQFGLTQAKNTWVLWLDADERVMPELALEIQTLVESNPTKAAFTVGRRAYFLGRWIKHSGWYPGRVARLFNKEKAKFNTASVHEGLDVQGEIGMLQNDLLHFTDPNIEHYFSKYNRYTTLAANELFKKNKHASLLDLLIRPFWMFLKMYILRLGMLDGVQGFILAVFSSSYVFTKYAKLWEKKFTERN